MFGSIALCICLLSSFIMARSFQEIFKGIRSLLIARIDVDHGLLVDLLDKEVINGRHVEDIKEFRTESERIERLLKILEKRDDCHVPAFCQALTDTDQQPTVIKILKCQVPAGVTTNGNDPDMSSVGGLSPTYLKMAQEVIFKELLQNPEIRSMLTELRCIELPSYERDPLYGRLHSQATNTLSKYRFPPESLSTVIDFSVNLLAFKVRTASAPQKRSVLMLLRPDTADYRRLWELQESGSLDQMIAEEVVELFDCAANSTFTVNWYICGNTTAPSAANPSPEMGQTVMSTSMVAISIPVITVLVSVIVYLIIVGIKVFPCYLKKFIEENADQLVQIIEPDYGLLDQLAEVKLISPEQRQTIQEKPTSLERNYQLLKHLSELNDNECKTLSKALLTTNQQHVVNVLCPPSGFDDTELSSKFGNVRPLTIPQKSIIYSNYSSLIELIDLTDDLLELLQSHGCITSEQRHRIISDRSVTDKNTRLLNILRRRSVRDYTEFEECLAIVSQQNIADILMSDPSGGAYDVKLPSDSFLSRTRKEVVEQKAYDVAFDPDNPSYNRGRMLVIANDIFKTSYLQRRKGTDVDVSNIKNAFSYLKFHIELKQNITAQEIRDVCIAESQSNKQSSVFALFLLSHGKDGAVLGVDGCEVKIKEIKKLFDTNQCKHLIGKPKLFFVQACQGVEVSEGASKESWQHEQTDMVITSEASHPESSTSSNFSPVVRNFSSETPHEIADMALVLASPPGYAAWRNALHGSYFVTHLTEVLLENAHQHDFEHMMTQVAARMNETKVRGGHILINERQTTLRKKLYLLPY